MFNYDDIIEGIKVEETEHGYRIEIIGNKERMKAAGFPERLTHFHERMQRFGQRGRHGPRGWGGRGRHRGGPHRHGWHGHHAHSQHGHHEHDEHHGEGHGRGHWAHHFDPEERFAGEEKPKRKRGEGVYYV